MSAKIYCTVMGHAIRIGTFGEAILNENVNQPVIVPDEVGREFEEEIRGERPNPRAGDPGQPATIKLGHAPRTDLRVVWDTPMVTGTVFVPSTGPAILHEGEMVLSADAAAMLRTAQADGVVPDGTYKDAAALKGAIAAALKRKDKE